MLIKKAIESEDIITSKDKVYTVIRERILSGQLFPGEKITEHKIADELDVSRSPTREAIKQLVGDGLLMHIPNRGAYVKLLTTKEIKDAFDARIMLEQYAVSYIDETVRTEKTPELCALKRKIEQKIQDDYLVQSPSTDKDIHTLIISLSNNQVIESIYEKLWIQIAWFRKIPVSRELLIQYLEEHILILDAIMRKNDGIACRYLVDHLTKARDRTCKYFETTK